MPNPPVAQQDIVIVGGGKMGEAILAGLLDMFANTEEAATGNTLAVVNPGAQRRAYLANTYAVATFASVAEVSSASLAILAVKPQVMPSVLEELAQCAWASNALFISIAAGITTTALEAALPVGAHVVRAMPNTPLLVGHGATALCSGTCASASDINLATDLFGAMGQAVVVEEGHMDAVTAISGSGPAYVAALAEAMAAAGTEAGLDLQLAETLAVATIEGTGALLRETGQGAAQVREAVCSPGGTTLAALQAMEEAGYSQSIGAGVQAAIKRSKELAQ